MFDMGAHFCHSVECHVLGSNSFVLASSAMHVFSFVQDLTLTLTGDFVDELARGYSQPWFQDLVRQCIEESGDQQTLLERLHDVAFEVAGLGQHRWTV